MDEGQDRRRHTMGIFLVLIFCFFTVIGGTILPLAISPVSQQNTTPPPSTDSYQEDSTRENPTVGGQQATLIDAEINQTETFDLLVFGTDRRPKETGNGRSDIIMVVSINAESGQIKLVSILRDTWVELPDYGWDRINAAYSYGGVELAMKTVNETFALDIQNYVILEFSDLEAIIDRLGGVDVNLTLQEIRFINRDDPKVQIPVLEGTYHINGTQALVHCRNRWTGEGDFERTKRQRDILLAMLESAKVELETGNPVTLLHYLINPVDTNLKFKKMLPLCLDLMKSPDLTVVESSVPYEGTWVHEQKNGRSVLVIDLQENVEQLHQFLNEE